jgi:hypothetical protein
MKYHDTDCKQFSFCSVMETRSCTFGGVITAVRWIQTTIVTKGCIWKGKTITKSRYETPVSSSSYSYHDAMQRAANSSHIPPLHSNVAEGLNIGIMLLHPRLCAEKLNNYWRLLILVCVFAVYKRTLFYLVVFYCLCINLGFICYNREVFLELEPTI